MSPSDEAAAAITIHDVAHAAGVSIKTVSRVLGDAPHVAAATRAAVHDAARRLGYTPHPSARNLAAAVSNVVGLVSLTPTPRSGFEYLMGLQVGVQAVCQAHDHGLMLLSVPRRADAALAELRRRVQARQVGGWILPAPACDVPGLLSSLDEAGLAYVAINPHRLDIAAPWVATNDRAAARRMTLLLHEAGHRRIALLVGDSGTRGATERLAGYCDALAECGLPENADWIEPAGYGHDRGREAAHRLLNRSPRPTAIVAASDDCAAGVIAAAHERGLTLPDELSITGFDDVDLARKVWPALTTSRQPLEEMAGIATRQLLARMHPRRQWDDPPPPQVMLEAELVRRSSVRAPPR